jgi:hypothetical protein
MNPDDTAFADKHLIGRRVSGPRSGLKTGFAPTDQPGENETFPSHQKIGLDALALHQTVLFEVKPEAATLCKTPHTYPVNPFDVKRSVIRCGTMPRLHPEGKCVMRARGRSLLQQGLARNDGISDGGPTAKSATSNNPEAVPTVAATLATITHRIRPNSNAALRRYQPELEDAISDGGPATSTNVTGSAGTTPKPAITISVTEPIATNLLKTDACADVNCSSCVGTSAAPTITLPGQAKTGNCNITGTTLDARATDHGIVEVNPPP